jgi:hypothetical protein
MPLTAENMKTVLKAWKAHKAGGALKEHEAGASLEPKAHVQLEEYDREFY